VPEAIVEGAKRLQVDGGRERIIVLIGDTGVWIVPE
jgi:hypothetical protein